MHLDFAHLNLSHIFLQRNFFLLFEILELGFICLVVLVHNSALGLDLLFP